MGDRGMARMNVHGCCTVTLFFHLFTGQKNVSKLWKTKQSFVHILFHPPTGHSKMDQLAQLRVHMHTNMHIQVVTL